VVLPPTNIGLAVQLANNALRFHFLGLPRVELHGTVQYFPSAKAAALTAYLALHPAPQSREKIIALFWSESDENAARKNLRNTLWAIRKLSGDVISTDNNCLSLTAPVWTDVQAVLSGHQSGVGCGDFLESLRLTEAPDIEQWITQVRTELSDVISTVYVMPTVLITPLVSRQTESPFVGREAERQNIELALRRASSGQTQIVALTGELGIGKSRLTQEWLSALPADSRHVILQTRCLASAQHLPLAPLVDLFGTKLCRTHIAQFVPDLMNPPLWLAEIAILFPEIADIAARAQGKPAKADPVDLSEMVERCTTVDHQAEQARLFEAFAQLVIAMLDTLDRYHGALIFVIDDLHWADAALINWLDYLLARVKDRRLLVVTTIRPDAASPALNHMLAAWGRAALLTAIQLPRLTLDETTRLAELLGVESLRAYQVRLQSDGNPYFLVELARAPDDQLPATLRDLLAARLNALPLPARKILGAAAVLEGDFTYDMLMQVAATSEADLLDDVDQLLLADILRERDGRYFFSHPMLGAVALNMLSSARREALMRQATSVLNRERAPQRSLLEIFPYVNRGVDRGVSSDQARLDAGK